MSSKLAEDIPLSGFEPMTIRSLATGSSNWATLTPFVSTIRQLISIYVWYVNVNQCKSIYVWYVRHLCYAIDICAMFMLWCVGKICAMLFDVCAMMFHIVSLYSHIFVYKKFTNFPMNNKVLALHVGCLSSILYF